MRSKNLNGHGGAIFWGRVRSKPVGPFRPPILACGEWPNSIKAITGAWCLYSPFHCDGRAYYA
jgi:hypothetical protein